MLKEGGGADAPYNKLKEEEPPKQDNKPSVLTRQQVGQCMLDIVDDQPLKFGSDIIDIIPFFGLCKKRKKDFRKSFRTALMGELGIKIPKAEQDSQAEPFLLLGYGINAYFGIMFSLLTMFFMISIFLIPVIWYYKDGNEVNFLIDKGQIAQYTLGNLGGAHTVCETVKLDETKRTFSCPQKFVIASDDYITKDINDHQFGLISNKITGNICTIKALDEEMKSKNSQNCESKLKRKELEKYIKETCQNKRECPIDFVKFTEKSEGQCDQNARFFAQLACIVETKKDFEREVMGLFIASMGVFIYFFVIVYIDFVRAKELNQFVDFDVKTISAGDYSVEFDINEKSYEKFKQEYYLDTNPMSEMAQFKQYVQSELEDRLNAMDNLGLDGPEEQVLKIAQITFAFDNSKIITLLIKRGNFLKAEKYDKVREVNLEIQKLIRDQTMLDKLQTPCSVFVTFETEEAIGRANILSEQVNLHLHPPHFGQLLGQEIEIQEASEPTDIIWENRHFTPRERTYKRVIVWSIIFLMLAASFLIIFTLKKSGDEYKNRYNKKDCQDLYKLYTKEELGTQKLDQNSYKEFYQLAEKEASTIREQLKNPEGLRSFPNKIHCFCTFDKKQNPKGYKQEEAELQSPDQKAIGKTVCESYEGDEFYGKVLGLAVTITIVVVNTILSMVIIGLVKWVGEDTNSEQLSSITTAIFAAQFFNTAIILLLVQANLTEHTPEFLDKYTAGGRFYDYSPYWYGDVGSAIAFSMVIQSIMPYINLIKSYVQPKVMQFLDSRGDPFKTKKCSMANFKKVYGGGDYVIHFKYSGVLNVVYVTMMYGIGMPILFPIAALNLFNQWICERLVVAYMMKRPPALDNKLSENCIAMLKGAPIVFLANGFWMVSNLQIFKSHWVLKDLQESFNMSDHHLKFETDWAAPMLLMTIVSIGLLFAQFIISDRLRALGFSMQGKEIEVDEDLPNFFDTIKLSMADEIISENNNMIKNYGFEPNDPDTINRLEKSSMPKRPMQGTPWYQALTDPKYSNCFSYIAASIQEREKIIEDGSPEVDEDNEEAVNQANRYKYEQSDMVVVLFNLSYIPDEVAKKLDFEQGWQARFLESMDEYKKNWEIKHGKAWQFTKDANDQVSDKNWIEEDYKAFKKRQHDKDADVLKSLKEHEIRHKLKSKINENVKNAMAGLLKKKKENDDFNALN